MKKVILKATLAQHSDRKFKAPSPPQWCDKNEKKNGLEILALELSQRWGVDYINGWLLNHVNSQSPLCAMAIIASL